MGRESRLRLAARGGVEVPLLGSPKVALASAYGGSVTGPFHDSVLRLQLHELSKPRPLLWHRLKKEGLYIDHNRNTNAENFLKSDADWLLQIDSDIEFPATLIETMLKLAGQDKKILAASVPLGPPFGSCAWMLTNQPGIFSCLASEQVPPEGVECDAVATAVILIHREVLEAIADREGQCWFLKILVPRLDDAASIAAWQGKGPLRDRRFISVGEDLAFCMRAQEAGYKPWCARIEGVRHHKTLPMSHDYESAATPAEAQEAR